jgi:hypothetical protein
MSRSCGNLSVTPSRHRRTCHQFEVDRCALRDQFVRWARPNGEEVLTDTIAAQVKDAARLRKWKGLHMPSTMMTFAHRRDHASKTINKLTRIAILGLTGIAITISPASALPTSAGNPIQQQFKQDSPIIQVYERRGGAVRRTTAVGPRGNVARHTTVVRPGAGRPGFTRSGAWVRPAHYRWRPGGAIAAGAAIGFVAAATAAAWAGAPPAPGYCWYYTDPTQTQGFWDVCP